MLKSDGSVLVHSDGGSYKPLNWMSPPCTVREGTTEDGQVEWTVAAKSGDSLRILIEEVLHDTNHDLGVDPGLRRTVSRSTCRSCSLSTRRPSARD